MAVKKTETTVDLGNLTEKQLQEVVEKNFSRMAEKVISIATEAHFIMMPDALVDQKIDFDLGRYVQRAWENCYGNVDSKPCGKGALDVVPATEVHNRTTKGWMDEVEARLQAALDGFNDDTPVADRANASQQHEEQQSMTADNNMVEYLKEQLDAAQFRYSIDRAFLDAWLSVYHNFSGRQFVNRAWVTRNPSSANTSNTTGGSLMDRMRKNLDVSPPSSEGVAAS